MSTGRANPQPQEKRNLIADLRVIGTLYGGCASAFTSNDAAVVAAYYVEDTVLMLPNQPATEGRPKIKYTPPHAQVAGNWAYERSIITEATTPKSGQAMELSLKDLAILSRQADGAWRVNLDIDNTNL